MVLKFKVLAHLQATNSGHAIEARFDNFKDQFCSVRGEQNLRVWALRSRVALKTVPLGTLTETILSS